MNIIRVPNVNIALHEGLWLLKTIGINQPSRNGPVLRAPGPVATVYANPTQRVLFHPLRDANPVFHLMEAIWMLAGRNDLQFLRPFNSRMEQYAESDGHFHGAYGYRWRNHFFFDQLDVLINNMRQDKFSRRLVLNMWDPKQDIFGGKADIPCNTHIYFDASQGKLDMTVCNRSNDVVMGAYGANVVHMSMLQELMAAGVCLPVGTYTQFSNNYHAYENNEVTARLLRELEQDAADPYQRLLVRETPMLLEGESHLAFLEDCARLVDEQPRGETEWQTAFFTGIAHPLFRAYLDRKEGKDPHEFNDAQRGMDWVAAYLEWVDRRNTTKEAA